MSDDYGMTDWQREQRRVWRRQRQREDALQVVIGLGILAGLVVMLGVAIGVVAAVAVQTVRVLT